MRGVRLLGFAPRETAAREGDAQNDRECLDVRGHGHR